MKIGEYYRKNPQQSKYLDYGRQSGYIVRVGDSIVYLAGPEDTDFDSIKIDEFKRNYQKVSEAVVKQITVVEIKNKLYALDEHGRLVEVVDEISSY